MEKWQQIKRMMFLLVAVFLIGIGPWLVCGDTANPRELTLYAKAGILSPVRLKFPKDYDRSSPAVLVIVMHGKGGAIQGMLPVWEAFDNPRFILAIAQAPYPFSGGWSWDFPSTDRRLWKIADPMISAYILNVIADIQADYPITSVYLFGHSQGVSYAYLTGLLHPEKIRGLVCFAGIYPKEFLPREKVEPAIGRMRFFIAHGRNDPQIGIESSEQARNILEDLGAEVRFFPFRGGHNLPADAVREAQKWIEADTSLRNDR